MHGIEKKFRGVLLGAILLAAQTGWTVDVTQMGFSELVSQAETAIEADDSASAVPLLSEIVERAGAIKNSNAQKSVQIARLQLASCQLKLRNWAEAQKYAKQYLVNKPAKDEHAALSVLCEVDLQQKDWKALLPDAKKLVEQSSSIKKRTPAHQYLLRGYFNNGMYDEALGIIPDLLSWIKKDAKQTLAVRGIQIECLVESDRMSEITTLLPVLFPGGDRSNVRLNLTLLRIGDKLFDRGDYRQALAIYRQVLPWVKPLAKSTLTMFDLDDQTQNVDQLEEMTSAMKDGAKYDLHVSYRTAQSYAKIDRYWEAISLFDQSYLDHAKTNEGKGAYLQKIMLMFEIGANSEAKAACTQYLDKGYSDFYARMICTRLAQFYLNDKQFDQVLALTKYVDEWAAPADNDEREQATNLLYIFAFVHFQRQSFDHAVSGFERVIAFDPGSERGTDSRYWIGMCHLMEQDYPAAIKEFTNYRQKWPQGAFAPAALFRSGVCRFGMEEYEKAKKAFKNFIDSYPNDSLMPESLTMYGDLLGADGELDQALESYQRAIEMVHQRHQFESDDQIRAGIVTAATYASMQAAKTLEQDAAFYEGEKDKETAAAKYRQIVEWMNRYMGLFGADADLAQAVYWIGKAEMSLGQTLKAVNAYLDAVVNYGVDPSEEGVTSILFELAGIIEHRLDKTERKEIIRTIKREHYNAKDPVLQIRLAILLAELDGTQEELGRTLLAENQNWEEVPPTGLSLICDAMLKDQQFDRAQEMFTFFEENHDASPYMVQAYHLLGEKAFQASDLDTAYNLAVDALGYYGATEYTGWAQLMKGKIESERGEYAEAAKTFNAVFGVRSWRGSIAAESMLLLAQAWEKQQNPEKAFAFYQRTYLLYKAYDNGKWAAAAYIGSAKLLQGLGRENDARNTYRAMLLDKYVKDLPEAKTAKKVLGPEETAELLAGITNKVEKVTLKEVQ